ncbi:hypothetical protein AQUCO_01100271v1 [Aquilegia coerulea]|uniref:Copper ion binding protein n=1 Tax=Aquilegia coerulea TaxID=218851 RepID=A0A2G5E6D0_AQUCA|nr:hypothetical protein AQUCO_01100271v1 [Aquilegia coerulea]
MLRSKLKPLISSSLSTLNHQFLQRCSVSGTAKGKKTLKAGGALKRSVIPKKKGAKTPSTGGGGGGGGRMNQASERLNNMVDSCLNAPTPIRYLTQKQKAREAEREKLGLISKARQRELDGLKAKAKKSEKSGEEEGFELMGPPGLDLITLGLVDKEKIPKYELNVEDGRRLAKEYSRVLMRQHRARRAAETTLLKMKKEAIEALPEHLKVAALVPDMSPFPANLFMATLTPPIEGYIDKINEAQKKNQGKAKLR